MVLVVDFGSQYTDLLVRQVRRNHIFAEVRSFDDPELLADAARSGALILSGSPSCARDGLHEDIFRALMGLGRPMLCVCYGMQVIHRMLGGEVVYGKCSEFGPTEVRVILDHNLVDGIPARFTTWMSHNDSVVKTAPSFRVVARTDSCHSIAADDRRKIYTIQFHPEVEHASYGDRLIQNFLLLICRLKPSWSVENILEAKVEGIRHEVGRESVYLALSGGLDSSVVAKLLKSSGVDAHYIFVNTGLFCDVRMKPVLEWMREEFGTRLRIIEASERFFGRLKGVTDPEEKRRAVGNMFIEVFGEEMERGGGSPFLAQGTIRSDLIESGRQRKSEKIKTHHNTIGALRERFRVLEPIADLFKDEIRELAGRLGMPEMIVNSQPFPGPGYAIRVMGEVTEDRVDLLKRVDAILHEELERRGLHSGISQCFAVMVNCRSVGVLGDRRNYGHVVAIRSVDSRNMMTAKPSQIPINVLVEIGSSITNRTRDVSRVVYDLTSKPPATIEWE